MVDTKLKYQDHLLNRIKTVKHPAINHTLFDLGILKSIEFNGNTAKIIMAFPFKRIPIADQLINSICILLKEKGFNCDVETTTMTVEEQQQFLEMEKAAWKE